LADLPPSPVGGPQRERIDKWLFFARVAKSRTLAGKLVAGGHVRVNGEKKRQPSYTVKPGDTLTIVLERRVLVYKLLECGTRRGPASEARLLYQDLSPPLEDERSSGVVGHPDPGVRSTSKKERRQLQRLKFSGLGQD